MGRPEINNVEEVLKKRTAYYKYRYAFISFGWITILAAILCIGAYLKTQHDVALLEKDGVVTQATITDTYRTYSRGGSGNWVSYRYKDESGREYTNTDAYPFKDFSDLKRNVPISIRYVKADPQISKSVNNYEFLHQGNFSTLLICVSLLLFIGVGLLLFGRRQTAF